jgi:transcriptional regulator GlxA family with amidase domain
VDGALFAAAFAASQRVTFSSHLKYCNSQSGPRSLLPPFKTRIARRLKDRTAVAGKLEIILLHGATAHRVGLILPLDFQLLNLAPPTVFEMSEMTPHPPPYEIHLLSEHGGPLKSSCGVTVETEAFGHPAFDTIIMGAITSFVVPAPSTADTLAFVSAAAGASRRTASFCNGAYVLAEAGLLDGRRATTHWLQASRFRAKFPKVTIEEDRIFIVDGPIWTSAGMTAGFDLVLAMVDSDMGHQAAQQVARLLVISQRRVGGQKQLTALLELSPKSDRIERVLNYIRLNLRNPLSTSELAVVASLGPRQLSRAFLEGTGQSPAKAVEQLRLEAARFMMEEGRLSVNEVAEEAGFGDRERMRRSFLRAFGVSAEALRSNTRKGNRHVLLGDDGF